MKFWSRTFSHEQPINLSTDIIYLHFCKCNISILYLFIIFNIKYKHFQCSMMWQTSFIIPTILKYENQWLQLNNLKEHVVVIVYKYCCLLFHTLHPELLSNCSSFQKNVNMDTFGWYSELFLFCESFWGMKTSNVCDILNI